jgi:hypothetical protein
MKAKGILFILFLLLSHAIAWATPPHIDYDADHDLLKVSADDCSLSTLMEQLSKITAIQIEVVPGAEKIFSFHSSGLSAEETLKNLIADNHLSHMFVYATKAGKKRLHQVKILPVSSAVEKTPPQNTGMAVEQRRQFLEKIKQQREEEFERSLPNLPQKPDFNNTLPAEPVIPQPPRVSHDRNPLRVPGWHQKSNDPDPTDLTQQPTSDQGGQE